MGVKYPLPAVMFIDTTVFCNDMPCDRARAITLNNNHITQHTCQNNNKL